MKTKLILLLLLLLMMGCNENTVKTAQEGKEEELPKEVSVRTTFEWIEDLVTVEHDNHELILWLNGYGSQMMHKPNCKFCKAKE